MTPQPRRCHPPSTLRFGSLPRLLDSLPTSDYRGDLIVDLSDLRWIEALPIAVLVALLKDHVRRSPGTNNAIRVPRRYEFLQRMDFFEAVGASVPERFRRHDPTGRFVPVREVERMPAVAEAAHEIVRTLRVDDEDAAQTLRHCVGEILDNVFVHARSPVNAVICAQHFPNAGRSQVAIVDRGIGFRESFAESPAYGGVELSDRDALILGLEPFVTSKPQTAGPYQDSYGRLGVGLFIASEILDQVGGRILLASGTHAVDRRLRRRRWSGVRAWAGSIIAFEVPDTPSVAYADALSSARTKARALEAARRPAREGSGV